MWQADAKRQRITDPTFFGGYFFFQERTEVQDSGFSDLIKCSLKWIIRSHSIYLFSVLFYLSFAYRFIDSWNGLFGKMNSNNQKCSSKTLQKWKVTNKAILKWENNQIGRKSKQEKKSRWSVSGARTELQFHELALVLETQVVLLILNTPN